MLCVFLPGSVERSEQIINEYDTLIKFCHARCIVRPVQTHNTGPNVPKQRQCVGLFIRVTQQRYATLVRS